ncbi:MAG: DUF58 domain-containing protein [Verrucomicrobiota bacterium]
MPLPEDGERAWWKCFHRVPDVETIMFQRYLFHNYRVFAALKYWLKRRITPAGWLVLGATLAAAALGVDTNSSLAYQTFTFLFCLVMVSAILACWSGTSKIVAERILPRFGSAQERLFYSFVFRNNSRHAQRSLHAYEELIDPRPTFTQFVETAEPGEERRNWLDRTYHYYRWNWLLAQNTRAEIEEQSLADLPPGLDQNVRAELLPLRRGVLRFAGVAIASPDPFGLFRSLRKIPAPQSVLILPKRYVIPPFELPGTMKYQQGGVSMASAIGESEEFVSLREYRPGDPLRRIHWKSFAKTGKPIVKEFQEEFFVRHALILDTFSAHAHSEVFEEAVSVAASLAFTIQNQDSLLDLMFVGPQAYCFTSGRGLGHTEQLLEILASVQICREKEFETLENLVLEHAPQISGCICVFLEWTERRKSFVQSLKSRGTPVMVFVVTETDAPVDPGPMAERPENFHVLPMEQVATKLAAL